MIIRLMYTLLFVIVLGLASCSNNPEEVAQDDPPVANRAEKVAAAEEKTLEDVVNVYLAIKDALVASDAKNAQAGAVELLGVVDATKMPMVQQKTKEMAGVTDLTMQRTHFDSLSIALYEQVKQQPTNSQTLYKQYCPMAFDNRGAFWLSRDEEIKNPYFGDEMLHCGHVQEEIKEK